MTLVSITHKEGVLHPRTHFGPRLPGWSSSSDTEVVSGKLEASELLDDSNPFSEPAFFTVGFTLR
jgi:hypothetical protein